MNHLIEHNRVMRNTPSGELKMREPIVRQLMVDTQCERRDAETMIEYLETRLSHFYWGAAFGAGAYLYFKPWATQFSQQNALLRKPFVGKLFQLTAALSVGYVAY